MPLCPTCGMTIGHGVVHECPYCGAILVTLPIGPNTQEVMEEHWMREDGYFKRLDKAYKKDLELLEYLDKIDPLDESGS